MSKNNKWREFYQERLVGDLPEITSEDRARLAQLTDTLMWDSLLKLLRRYQAQYQVGLMKAEDEKEADQFRGNVQALAQIKGYVMNEVERQSQLTQGE